MQRSKRVASFAATSLLIALVLQNCAKDSSSLQDFFSMSKDLGPRRVIAVDSLGAKPDGSADSTAAVQNAINIAVQSAEPTDIVFSQGRYRLTCPKGTEFGNCLNISGGAHLRLIGAGSDLTRFILKDPLLGFISARDSAEITLQNFSVEYEPMPFDQDVRQERGSSLFFFIRNHNVQLKNITAYGSPGNVATWIQNTGFVGIDALNAHPESKGGVSAHGDGLSFVDNLAKVSIQNCHLEDMSGDAIVTSSSAFVLEKKYSSTEISFKDLNVQGFTDGQTLQIIDRETQQEKGIAKITYISSSKGMVYVALDREIENLREGDFIFNEALAVPNLLVKNNSFTHFAGIFRIHSSGAMFLNNKVDRKNAKIYVAADVKDHLEGPSLLANLAGIYVLNNSSRNSMKVLGATAMSGMVALLAHPLVFDPEFYRSSYADLGKMTDEQLRLHWVRVGLVEGRRAKIDFNAPEYLQMYPELRAAFGEHNYADAAMHFVQQGAVEEQRLGSTTGNDLVFNAPTYRRLNPDKASLAEVQLELHWLNHGVSEGRQASPLFNSKYYLERNSDLQKTFGVNNYRAALLHFVTKGFAEGRRGTGPAN